MILKNGLIVDGTRCTPYRADIGIQNGLISVISASYEGDAAEVLDLNGLAVSPGFIDIHTHSDASPLVDYDVESKLCQGVTFELGGNCGISMVPSDTEYGEEVASYYAKTLEQPLHGLQLSGFSMQSYCDRVTASTSRIHYGLLVGHGTLRLAVMDFVNRDPSSEELERLKTLLDRELKSGAFGMSLGLIYPPSSYSKKEELIELAKVVKVNNAILTVHLRNESVKLFEAVDEMLEIAEKSGVHLHISHLKLMGTPQWGRAGELLEKLETGRRKGLNITCDQYPFNASSTSMTAMVPGWAHAGGSTELLKRLDSRENTIMGDIENEMANRGGPSSVLVTGTHGSKLHYEGRTVEEISKSLGLDAAETVRKVLLDCEAAVACVYFSMDEQDVRTIMRDMRIAIASDGYSLSYDRSITTSVPHPRNFGTFPRFLQMVREEKLMSLQDAIYKITGLPAETVGLRDRGILKAGKVADITVFDPNHVKNNSTFMESRVRPQGIIHVLVGGKFALRDGATTSSRNGSVLLHR